MLNYGFCTYFYRVLTGIESMPTVTIDGKVYEYEGKHRLLQFALDNGVEIPYFCYHPAMSAPTNCRMCLVDIGYPMTDRATGQPVLDDSGQQKIQFAPKPLTSCNQDLNPGMVVQTNRTSERIKKAQEGVLEFLLINHPLDCPICDQAGECPLQINTYKFGPEGSRFELDKVHKPKRIDLGPNVVLDAERCINCTRCTRFTEEISGTWQLSIHNRGDKNYPTTAPGQVFDDPYSMNVIDLCPVGALTSANFRFKARVWEMSYTPSICTGCAKGCNTQVWVRDNEVLRLTPRENAAVNAYWMCDEGRLDIAKYNEKRISGAKLKGDVPVSFEDAYIKANALLQQHKGHTFFVGSGHASTESNHAFIALARHLGAKTGYVAHIQPDFADKFLKKEDRTPNTAGVKLTGFEETTLEHLRHEIEKGHIRLIYVLEDSRVLEGLSDLFDKTDVIAQTSNYPSNSDKIKVILPAATSIESAGTFINADGIAQITRQAKEIKQMTPEMWMGMAKSRSDKAAVQVDNWRTAENIVDCLPGYVMIHNLATLSGLELHLPHHKEALHALKHTYPSLKDLKVSKFIPKESFKMNQFEFAIN
jgi:NADH-quinone oxidoreductase subunit G